MRPDMLSPLEITPGMVLNALESLHIAYKASDKEAVVACPFHGDVEKKHCYINVRERPGVFHCFYSECEARGDFIEFLVGLTGWNGYKVIAFCRGLSNVSYVKPAKQVRTQADEEDPLAKYKYRSSYLQDRGISEEVQRRFQIGYDRENTAIVFPWFDRNGKLVAIKKRQILEKFFTYEIGADMSQTLYGLNLAGSYGFFWLVESEIDAMTLDQVFRMAHFDNHYALALGGNDLARSQWAAAFQKMPKAIVLMLDNDIVGRESQARIKKQLIGNVRVYEAEYPHLDYKDANELNFEQIVGLVMQVIAKEEERKHERL